MCNSDFSINLFDFILKNNPILKKQIQKSIIIIELFPFLKNK